MFSHEQIKTDFKPFYLYESVTKNIEDFDDQAEEEFPPKGQHLVMFFLAQINESWQNIHLELKKAEVQSAAWVHLKDLNDCF